MSRTTTDAERERKRAEAEALTSNYRAIGPAAVLAALICLKSKDERPSLAGSRAA
ncbi:transcriptional regulator [Nitratireductor mangrovi]|uniref:Transcriptional regulator n=1 Tax=Nitratireductor mangrovi TaxID=2599600 RepID=A0A5B8KTH2_9HYPH|nr:transcriptional regulator [Nitratireductor mangrovi]QDY98895.1 transcriptional regulator [Nitratireductor mangrovi]